MFWLRPSLFFILPLLFSFKGNDCFHENFQIKVNHSEGMWGLGKVSLKVEKNNCVVEIRHKKYFYRESHWKVDICRGPVHIKKMGAGIDVLKRESSCPSKLPFCEETKVLAMIVQDDGLIFAKGERYNLKEDHGRVNCASKLLKAYLDNGQIFDRRKTYSDDYKEVSKDS